MSRDAILVLVLVLVALLAETELVLAQQEYSGTSSSLGDEDYTDNAIDLVPTSTSSLEEFLLTISNPFRIFNRPEDQLDRNTERFFLGLPPGIREVFFAGRAITQNGFGQVMNQYGKRIQAIFPGTRWCGSGDLARSPNDIGIFSLTDTCCRTHDACPEYILAGGSNRGLKNNGIFARSHCSCDEKFHQCLRNTPTLIAKKIGVTYFDVLQPQCFKLEYPIKQCIRYTSFPGAKRCVMYEFERSGNKTWQWFDNPNFLGH